VLGLSSRALKATQCTAVIFYSSLYGLCPPLDNLHQDLFIKCRREPMITYIYLFYQSFCFVSSSSQAAATHSHPKASPLTMLQYLTF